MKIHSHFLALLPKSIVAIGLFSIVACVAFAGCGKPVAKQKDLTTESKEELRAKLQERAKREQQGL